MWRKCALSLVAILISLPFLAATAQPQRYALISPGNIVLNLVVWDGVTPFNVTPNTLVQTNDPNAQPGATFTPPATFTPATVVPPTATNIAVFQPVVNSAVISAVSTKKMAILDSATGQLIGFVAIFPN